MPKRALLSGKAVAGKHMPWGAVVHLHTDTVGLLFAVILK